MWFERMLASLALAACLVAMLRLVLKERQRQRLDALFRSAWQPVRRAALKLRRRPAPPPDPARLTEEVIRRAREGHWEGNVYKPRAFRRPKKPH
jgi:hypothetical protein